MALVTSIVTFAFSLYLPFHYESGFSTGFQFDTNHAWIGKAIHYHMAADGISMWLVLLTTFLVPVSVLVSWKSIHDRVKEFFVLLLVLETAMIGVFLALDMFLFYVFWEATLIPMALLIGMFGHGRRIYAAVKFFLYTMVASVFMLVAIIWLYTHTQSFDYRVIREWLRLATSAWKRFSRRRCSGCSWVSLLPSPSKSLSSLCTHGCPMRTWKRLPPGPSCWPACC